MSQSPTRWALRVRVAFSGIRRDEGYCSGSAAEDSACEDYEVEEACGGSVAFAGSAMGFADFADEHLASENFVSGGYAQGKTNEDYGCEKVT